MKEVLELANTAGGADAQLGLRAVRALRQLAETLEQLQVENARRQGMTWQQIATALGTSRQAAHQKHGSRRFDNREKGT